QILRGIILNSYPSTNDPPRFLISHATFIGKINREKYKNRRFDISTQIRFQTKTFKFYGGSYLILTQGPMIHHDFSYNMRPLLGKINRENYKNRRFDISTQIRYHTKTFKFYGGSYLIHTQGPMIHPD